MNWVHNQDTLLEGFRPVRQLYKSASGCAVNTHQKPLLLLANLLETHGKGPPPCNQNWVLDAGCGSGSASHAALLSGMNVIAFDYDEDMVQMTTERLTSLHNVYTADEEILTNAEIKVLKEKQAKEKARQEEEEEEEEEEDEAEEKEKAEDEEVEAEEEDVAEMEVEGDQEPQLLFLEHTPAEQTQPSQATIHTAFVQGICTAMDEADTPDQLEAMLKEVQAKADAAAAAGSKDSLPKGDNPTQTIVLEAHAETQRRRRLADEAAAAEAAMKSPGKDKDKIDKAVTQGTQEKAAALGQAKQAEEAEQAEHQTEDATRKRTRSASNMKPAVAARAKRISIKNGAGTSTVQRQLNFGDTK